MPVSPISRVTTMASSNSLLSTLQRTQREMFEAQNTISTGLAVNTASEAPDKAAAIMTVQGLLEARNQYDSNIAQAKGLLSNADSSLADAVDLLLDAQTLGQGQIGIGSDKGTRENQSVVATEQLNALLDIANRQVQNVSLFGGITTQTQVFEEFMGGIRYVGSEDSLSNRLDEDFVIDINSSGTESFGALSSRVQGNVDLDPNIAVNTKLADLSGAQARGIRQGLINVDVNGTAVSVDLTNAITVNDVITRVNDAITGINPAAGSLAIGTSGINVTANAGFTITISDPGAGEAAGDLGIETVVTGATNVGSDLDPSLADDTLVADFGAAVDLLSGMSVTQGITTVNVDFATANTIQDMKNIVQSLDIGLRLEINELGNGLDFVSEVSGLKLSIGENGGTTASDLGLRSFDDGTLLSDFRLGQGVEPVNGEDDVRFTLHDGRSFDVNLDSANTAGDVLTLISAAAAAAGIVVGAPGAGGTDFNLGYVPTGNGFRFEDNTAGASDFEVSQLNASVTATQLGIFQNVGAGGTIDGSDEAQVYVDSVFTHMIWLRDSLASDDTTGIIFATDKLTQGVDNVNRARADISIRLNRVEQQEIRSQDMRILDESTLSELREGDLTEVITRFQLLQQQLQASLTVGAQNLQTSFLDFLR